MEQALAATGRCFPQWVALPNFVDVHTYRPVSDASERGALRRKLGLPERTMVLGTVAAVKKTHKRIDSLINEFSALSRKPQYEGEKPWLLVVGASTGESQDLVRAAEQLAPGRFKFLFNVPRASMPEIYRVMDVFALSSLFEMMPIAVLEALASGLPVIANRHPVLDWMTGGVSSVDMSIPGALAEKAGTLDLETMRRLGMESRHRAENMFSAEAVVPQYLKYYSKVCENAG